MAEHLLLVTPHIRPDGRKHPNAFDARLASTFCARRTYEVLCVSETPFFDGARALLKAGLAQPGDILVMRHLGSDHDALRAKVGVAAGFTIQETGFGPRRRPYVPHPGLAVAPGIEREPEPVA